MGMYNEVFKKCPHCEKNGTYGRGYLQISQILLGFGGFDLDNPDDIAERLSVDEVQRLKESVEGEWFRCDECKDTFRLGGKEAHQEKMDILNSLNSEGENED